ncbi:M48 family metallopeptidase [Wenxinia saemankumensis]|uniref:Peptidase family M48 n=1 Tax=Wenxinia saemankumensis TaxID=1447782 RepID=A0A1M6CBA8_9RHOB|nr:M48 family metallopeptidase [Wenxinia saemankumensis]SHI58173.1 Peptidase family M48 [Wenxinia saemankumensis]
MTTRRLAALITALAGLSACAAPAPAPTGVAPSDVVVVGDRSVPAGAVPPSPASLDGRIQGLARAFVAVADRVEPAAEAACLRQAGPGVDCDFQIVLDDRTGAPPNAFQTEDRRGRPIIAFTVSLLGQVENADEMAFIIAHEAAHHIEGHLARQREYATLGATVFGQLAGAGGATDEAIRTAQQMGAVVGARTYSRDFELEADALGTVITAEAGYDPLVGSRFFFRLPDPGDRFLGTHPPNAQRLAIVQQTAARLGY